MPVTLDRLSAALQEVSERRGKILYFKEDSNGKVVDIITREKGLFSGLFAPRGYSRCRGAPALVANKVDTLVQECIKTMSPGMQIDSATQENLRKLQGRLSIKGRATPNCLKSALETMTSTGRLLAFSTNTASSFSVDHNSPSKTNSNNNSIITEALGRLSKVHPKHGYKNADEIRANNHAVQSASENAVTVADGLAYLIEHTDPAFVQKCRDMLVRAGANALIVAQGLRHLKQHGIAIGYEVITENCDAVVRAGANAFAVAKGLAALHIENEMFGLGTCMTATARTQRLEEIRANREALIQAGPHAETFAAGLNFIFSSERWLTMSLEDQDIRKALVDAGANAENVALRLMS